MRGLGRVSKDSNEIPCFRFMGMLDLADSSTKEEKRMQLGSGRMHPFCMGHKVFLHAQCRREKERERDRGTQDSFAEVTALWGRVILPISYQKFSPERSPSEFSGEKRRAPLARSAFAAAR